MTIKTILSIDYYLICPWCNSQKIGSFNLVVNSEKLKCTNCSRTYPILGQVPILAEDFLNSEFPNPENAFPETINLSNRGDFYRKHYSNRSRLIDLQSGYLSNEIKVITNFIQSNEINGLCLDVGCGSGIFADVSSNYLGLDYSLSAVFAEGFTEYARVIASAESIPLPNQSVQLIFSFNTLEHIPNPELAFREIDRVLMPNGYAILNPAWHCTRYNTELLPIKEYQELSLSQRLRKFLIPLLKSKPYKVLTRIPVRVFRRLSHLLLNPELPTELRYRKLNPYLGSDAYIADCDATADIDCHEGLLYFESRGYDILSHKTVMSRLLAGNDVLVLQKPMP